MKKATVTGTQVSLPPLRLETAEVSLIGTTPLITHAWSKKAREEMLAKQMMLPTAGREAKEPIQDFLRSMYRTDAGHYGLPAVAVKDAMVEACTSVASMTKVAARQAFNVVGERGKATAAFCDMYSPIDLVRIYTPEPPRIREDMVRVGMGSADLRYRPEFWPWALIVRIRFNTAVMSAEQLMNLMNTAGFGVGLCEWRPQKGGQSGCFAVANEVDVQRIRGWAKAKQPEPELPDVAGWLAGRGVAEKPKRKLKTA